MLKNLHNHRIDISVVVTAHHEGRLAHHTMNSIWNAIRYANGYGVQTEIVMVLDSPDEKTAKYFHQHRELIPQIHFVDFGDPGTSRNYGVQRSSGKYIAFLDADDLFGKHWLKAAYGEARETAEYGVYHPEYVVCFERETFIVKTKSVYDRDFRPGNLIEFNSWNSVHFFAERALLLENPFVRTPCDSGFGYEDWHWNCEMIAKGIPIKVVPETCVFYRKKMEGSRLDEHNLHKVLVPPSKLFEPRIFSARLTEKANPNMNTQDPHDQKH